MTSEEQLDETLRFLLTWNKSGSYLYYKDDDVKKEYDDNRDRLEKHFKNVGIEEPYRDPIILHLINDRLVNYFYVDPRDKENALAPQQIKISFKGIMFINNGGYVKFKEKEAISKNLQLVQTWAIAIGTALAGLWSLYLFIKEFTNWCNC